MTSYYTIINIGSIFAVIIALSVSQKNKNDADFVFTQGGNETGWSSDGFAFLLGLLSVAWTMTDCKSPRCVLFQSVVPRLNIELFSQMMRRLTSPKRRVKPTSGLPLQS